MDALEELRTMVGRYGTPKGFTPDGLDLRFTASTTLLEPVCSVEGPAFAMVLQGAKRTMVGQTAYLYGAGECLVISLELPITAQVTRASRTGAVSEPGHAAATGGDRLAAAGEC